MNIKNKIIKWLGGYTQDELVEQKKIEFCRTEKQILTIKTQFAAYDLDHIEYIKHNLCYQIADFILKYDLVYYDTERDEENNCYIVHAIAHVREP